jgi:hypothetical protein
MANINIPGLTALTAPVAADVIEVYDDSASENKKLALSYVALVGAANVFTDAQTISKNGTQLTASMASATNGATGWIYSNSGGGANQQWGIAFEATTHSIYRLRDGAGALRSPLYINASGGGIQILDDRVQIGTLSDYAQLTVQSGAAGTIGLVVNSAASPTVTIAEFWNNGTAKLKVGAEGILDYTGTMGNSAATVGTTAVADWVEIKIGGAVYYLPAYS